MRAIPRFKDKSYADNLHIENQLFEQGFANIAFTDEVGRGCFAGPVVSAAVIMPRGIRIPYLTDSKKVAKKMHRDLEEEIKKISISYAISVVSPGKIDEINILQASLLSMKNAVEDLAIEPDFCLVDGNQKIDINVPQQTVEGGDFYVHGISAASLLAKTYRDKLMAALDEEYNGRYEWSKNVGYPTSRHIELTREHGVTEQHRKTWKTMKKVTN